MFQLTDLHCARDSHVQKPHELFVDDVDTATKLFDARQDFSHRTYSSTRLLRSSLVRPSAITLTRALPTTAASAHLPTSRTCSGLEMPNPSAMGRELQVLILRTISSAPSAITSRAPVTPSREIAYRKPLPSDAALRRRSSVVVGLSRRIVSIPREDISARNSPASSMGRSSTSTPSTPASRARSAKRSVPSRRIGFT